MIVEKVKKLSYEDTGLSKSVARFHSSNIDSKRRDQARFFRREALIIENRETGDKVLRYAMGNPGGISLTKKEVGLDYDAVDALNIRFNTDVALDVRRAKPWEIYRWFLNHPDLGIQLSVKLGFVGAVLGLMGFIVGVAPLFL